MYPLDVFVGFFALFFDPPKNIYVQQDPSKFEGENVLSRSNRCGGALGVWRKRTNEIRLQEKNTPEVSIKKWMGPSQRTPN